MSVLGAILYLPLALDLLPDFDVIRCRRACPRLVCQRGAAGAAQALHPRLEPDATRRLDKPEQSSRRPDSSDATQTAWTASGQSSRSSDMTGQSGHCPHTPRV